MAGRFSPPDIHDPAFQAAFRTALREVERATALREEAARAARKLRPRKPRTWKGQHRPLAACATEHARLVEMIHEVGMASRLRAGSASILAYLNDLPPEGLGLRNLAGRPITWKRVHLWFRKYGFPLLPGLWRAPSLAKHRPRGLYYRAITSEAFIVAWVLSRSHNRTFEHFVIHARGYTPIHPDGLPGPRARREAARARYAALPASVAKPRIPHPNRDLVPES